MPPTFEKATFPGSQGAQLAGRLELPGGPPLAHVLFAHCFTCSKQSLAAARLSRALAARGFAVLRFDFTGLGESGGDFAHTDFSSNIEDLVAAAAWLRGRGAAPSLLVGHSLGGAAVLAAAGRIPEVKAVAAIAAPAEPAFVRGALEGDLAEVERRGETEVSIAGQPFRVRREFLEDIASHRLEEAIRRLAAALLVLHSPQDDVVPIEHAGRIFAAARHPKSFVSLDGADHLLLRREDADYAASVLAAWAGRFVGGRKEIPEEEAPPAGEGVVIVAETGEGKFTQSVRAGKHSLRADEPRSSGGDDAGPSPYDFLLAGLGACTSMTIRMYADRKKWPLEGVRVVLRHAKIHAEDCETCETKEGKVDRIEREIALSGDLDGEQRKRLIEIAEKCPVHRTLESEISIVTREGEAEPS
ncbi:MAG: alpha/beta fold hydrolase [Candidatus Tectomicrobia bacterium]|uniref:Alpha/beta fold hydrolase n=1 Tax=Tectimicrobiota bacterium TaxID=2528274 RepID=A0A932I2R1_UNCTE|nr:alpha/beta fold hydrolase [Candidatus Tectomicrobia bacterium]